MRHIGLAYVGEFSQIDAVRVIGRDIYVRSSRYDFYDTDSRGEKIEIVFSILCGPDGWWKVV